MAIVIDFAQARYRAKVAAAAERFVRAQLAQDEQRQTIEALGRLVVEAGPYLSADELLRLLSLVRGWPLNR